MFLAFFTELRDAKVPVTLREYLTLIDALDQDLAEKSVDDFYYLSRACLVKDERNLDKFDRVFGHVFKGLEASAGLKAAEIPEEWLRKMAERYLTEEEKSADRGDGRLGQAVGDAEASAQGAEGAAIRAARNGSARAEPRRSAPTATTPKASASARTRAAIAAPSRFGTSASSRTSTTRSNSACATSSSRCAACAASPATGAPEELDLDGTIQDDGRTRATSTCACAPSGATPSKCCCFSTSAVRWIGTSRSAEELFSAARLEFKRFEYFYFHNCLYESVWKDNRRRHAETHADAGRDPHLPSDYRVVFVGDASMSPYEILMPGGSVEHWNEEPGQVWLERLLGHFHKAVWLNPVPQKHWGYTHSIALMRRLFGERMFPLTLEGIDQAMRELAR